MKDYMLRVKGNDTFFSRSPIPAENMEEAAAKVPFVLERLGKLTIEQFTKIELVEQNEQDREDRRK